MADNGYLPASAYAPVVQWIERGIADPKIQVRFLVGAQALAGGGHKLAELAIEVRFLASAQIRKVRLNLKLGFFYVKIHIFIFYV